MISHMSLKKGIIFSFLILFFSISIGHASHQNLGDISSTQVVTDPNTGDTNINDSDVIIQPTEDKQVTGLVSSNSQPATHK
jgi:hypothetical protein